MASHFRSGRAEYAVSLSSWHPAPEIELEALLSSTALVALAEIGDKTQLLAIVLVCRYHKPVPIILGILVATLANHFLAALLGDVAASLLDGIWFRYAVAAAFIAMAAWTLVPDKLDIDDTPKPRRFGVFATTLIAFFFVEMGDKTQIATVALGARYADVLWVTAGTTLGMMIANVPAVLLGKEVTRRVPLGTIRLVAAIGFLAVGVWMVLATAGWM